jgi:Uma2 family endonuclease
MSAQSGVAYRWTSDDSEESIVGADWHQDAIRNLIHGLREVARAEGWPWHVGDQLTLVAWHPDGTRWRPIPDVMVHPRAGAAQRAEMNAHTDGLPALIIEVASPSTYASDVHSGAPERPGQQAKAYEYLAWPLPEYLVFDPTGNHLDGQVSAWRVVQGQVQEWLPNADGHYQSEELGIAFRAEGFLLRIYDPAGRPVLFDVEKASVMESLEKRAIEAEHRAARAAQLEEENAQLREQVARLRAETNGPQSC